MALRQWASHVSRLNLSDLIYKTGVKIIIMLYLTVVRIK